MIMYFCEQTSSGAPGGQWQGPARIIGFDGDVVWLQHGAVPVATAMHLMRPATTAELLAAQVMSRNMRPTAYAPMPTEEQTSYLDETSRPQEEQVRETTTEDIDT